MNGMKLLILIFLWVLGIGSVMFYVWTSANKAAVLAHARGMAEVVEELRQTYTEHRSDSNPLPIIFARALFKRLTSAKVRIYSPYPFPTNSSGGLHDDFQQEAWNHLNKKPNSEFISWKSDTLRYAIPDRMTARCVACHNSHPDTPKSDWKFGDVRGIIEIAISY